MESSPERRKISGTPSPAEPHVEMHHVLGEEIEATTKEEVIAIREEILAYEEGLLTAVELNPSLTLKAKENITRKQKKIIQQAKEELEKAKGVENAQ